MHRAAWLVLLSGIMGFLACELLAQSSPVLRPLDRVRVLESEAFLLGRVTGLHVTSSGRYLLLDAAEARVVELDSRGRPIRSFGRSGSGPGELRMPTAVATSGDSLLSVLDAGAGRVMNWDLRTGAVRGSFSLAGRITQLQYTRGQLRVGLLDPQATTALYTVTPAGQRTSAEGRRPPMLDRSPPLLAAFGAVSFVEDGEDTYAVFEVASSLYRWPRGATNAEQTSIPAVARKGVRAELFDELMRDPGKAATLLYDRSIPYSLHRLGPGLLALVTVDPSLGKTDLIGVFHVSVLDMSQRRACVDAMIPVPPDPLPTVTFARDTLVVLHQGETDTGEPTSWLQKYRLDVSGCRWQPLAPAVPVRD